jgi:hypothetical protein
MSWPITYCEGHEWKLKLMKYPKGFLHSQQGITGTKVDLGSCLFSPDLEGLEVRGEVAAVG